MRLGPRPGPAPDPTPEHDSTASEQEEPEPRQVEPYRLPFDGRRPILVTGPPYADKSAFVAHLLRHHSRGGHVFDPTGSRRYEVAGRDVSTWHPEDFASDKDFFAKAAEVLASALEEPDQFVVIEELHLLTTPYEPRLYEQEMFLYVLDEALRTARMKPGRLLVTSTPVLNHSDRDRYGCHFFVGPVLPSDWVMTFRRTAPAVEPLNLPGTGVLHLDGHFETFEFPLVEPDTAEEPKRKRLFSRRRATSDAGAEKPRTKKAKTKKAETEKDT